MKLRVNVWRRPRQFQVELQQIFIEDFLYIPFILPIESQICIDSQERVLKYRDKFET